MSFPVHQFPELQPANLPRWSATNGIQENPATQKVQRISGYLKHTIITG
jgi:hypothetical protein